MLLLAQMLWLLMMYQIIALSQAFQQKLFQKIVVNALMIIGIKCFAID